MAAGMNQHPSSRSRSGFSLVEVMIVMVTVGLLLSIAAPRMGGYFARVKADGVADQIATDLAYARSLAVRQGRPVQLRYFPASYTYVVQENPGPSAIARRHGGLEDGMEDVEVTFFPASQDSVVFSPRGLKAQGADSVVVTFRGNRSRVVVTQLGRAYRG